MTAEKHLTPVWIVYVDGKRLDTEHEGALQKIHMDDVLDGAGACTLEFDTSAVRIAESGTFSLESVVSVHMGYKDDCEQVFSGEVTDFQIKCNEYGNEQLFVTCHNCLHKMQNSHKAESFESKRLSDILRGIVDAYSLKSEIEDFGATKAYQAEISTTDFDFLLESARKYGKTVYAYESTVYVKNEVTVRDDDIILEWGKSLISFTADERLKGQISECTLTGWDADACKPISGSASLKEIPLKIGGSKSWEDNSNGAGGKWSSVFVESDLYDNDDAKSRAIGKLVESSFSYQTGVAKCEGDYRIHPGMRVSIKYVGKRFSGEYIADRVEHDLSVGGAFTTTVHLKRNFCESSIHKESSAVDREMADESFNSKLKIDQSKWIAQAGISDVPVYFNDYGNASNDPNVITGRNIGEIPPQPRYFNQRDFSDTFGSSFGNNACATTSLLNEISEQYTANTGMQMSNELAEQAMAAAINSNNVSANDANVNNWEGAANDMWTATGENGSFTYGGENPTATIYAEDSDRDGVPEHFTNSNGDGTYHDPWSGQTGDVGDSPLQEGGLGPTRTLTYSPDGE